MLLKTLLSYVLPKKLKLILQEIYCSRSISLKHGIASIQLKPNEAAVTCILKNGEYYIESFIDHYTELGFRHIFLLDNGSTDKTIALAKKYDNVSILESLASVGKYQGILKRVLANRVVSGGWCLDVDIDEYFDYPYSKNLQLNKLLDYLNEHKYSAVMTQMLDMFSDEPLSHLLDEKQEDVREAYRYYDLSNIEKIPYKKSELGSSHGSDNILSEGKNELCFGGIRKSLYGLNCLLSKHSLFSRQEKTEPFPFNHVHFVNKVRIADFSCVLLHYKLTSNAFEVALRNKNEFRSTSQGYANFIELMESKSSYYIKQDTAEKLTDIHKLIKDDFLFASERFLKFAGDQQAPINKN